MFLAHMPAGYLLHKALIQVVPDARNLSAKNQYRLLFVALLASVLPDFDLTWYYLVDNRAFSHHYYWPHIPVFWLTVCSIGYGVAWALKHRFMQLVVTWLFAATLLHCALDTIVGGIFWLQPFDGQVVRFFTVPDRYSWWPMNFVMHWSAFLELAIISVALLVWAFTRQRPAAPELA